MIPTRTSDAHNSREKDLESPSHTHRAENWNWKFVKEGIRGRQDEDVTGKEHGWRHWKRIGKEGARRQSKRQLRIKDMTSGKNKERRQREERLEGEVEGTKLKWNRKLKIVKRGGMIEMRKGKWNESMGKVLCYVREREGIGKSWKRRKCEKIWNWKISGKKNRKCENFRKVGRMGSIEMWNKIGKYKENWKDERW